MKRRENIDKFISEYASIDALDRELNRAITSMVSNYLPQVLGTTAPAGQQDTRAGYTSAQEPVISQTPTGSGIGTALATSLGGFALNQLGAEIAFRRQNKFYNEHLSMQAKAQEYAQAGLNPMALAGAGAGATSAPQVAAASAPDMSNILGTLLDYKTKQRELDIREAETTSRISLNTATIGKIFADTDNVSVDTYLKRTYGDAKEAGAVANLLKDLGVKDATITKTQAETAVKWLEAEWLPLLNAANIKQMSASATASLAKAAIDNYTLTYMKTHDGMTPPSGEIAAIVTTLMNSFQGGSATGGLIDTLGNPFSSNSPIGGTIEGLKQLFGKRK